MASAIPDHIDRLIALMEGTYSSGELSMSTGRFQHVASAVEHLSPNSAQAPYPFDIEDNGEFQPTDVPVTLSSIQRWHGINLNVRIAYAIAPHNETERQKTIQRDRYQIRRVLGEPDNWDAVTGFSNVIIGSDTGPTAESVPGSDEDAIDLLVIPVALVFREDHTT